MGAPRTAAPPLPPRKNKMMGSFHLFSQLPPFHLQLLVPGSPHRRFFHSQLRKNGRERLFLDPDDKTLCACAARALESAAEVERCGGGCSISLSLSFSLSLSLTAGEEEEEEEEGGEWCPDFSLARSLSVLRRPLCDWWHHRTRVFRLFLQSAHLQQLKKKPLFFP